jgi:RNA polymerase sigma-70 factor (ECF subfamily)
MVGCLDHLGKLQRAVVSLRMLDEVAGEDVAAMLGLPSSHVAVLLHRAKQSLRTCMLSAGYRPAA